MSEPYQEIVEGETLLRLPPGERHERVLSRLHVRVANCLLGLKTTRLLPPRSVVQLSAGTLLRPDLALVTAATNKLWLVAVKQILAGREFLVEPLLPGFKQAVHELFAGGLSADELKKLDF